MKSTMRHPIQKILVIATLVSVIPGCIPPIPCPLCASPTPTQNISNQSTYAAPPSPTLPIRPTLTENDPTLMVTETPSVKIIMQNEDLYCELKGKVYWAEVTFGLEGDGGNYRLVLGDPSMRIEGGTTITIIAEHINPKDGQYLREYFLIPSTIDPDYCKYFILHGRYILNPNRKIFVIPLT